MTSQNPGCLAAFLRLLSPQPKRKSTAQAPASDREDELPASDSSMPEVFPYRVRDDFLSPAETSFYHVLKSMTQERLVIFSKVSLAELFFVSRGDSFQTFQNKIDRKRVDFLLCDPKTLKPVLGIELDDASHRRPSRQERDTFVEKVFADAKLPLARVPVKMSYSQRELAALFQAAMTKSAAPTTGEPQIIADAAIAPNCPKCGVPMLRRIAKRGNTPGQEFWGCPNYPRCREVIAVS